MHTPTQDQFARTARSATAVRRSPAQPASASFTLAELQQALAALPEDMAAVAALHALVQQGLDRLPGPGSGATLSRWQALAAVARHDLSLAKVYEGHTDALAILQELGAGRGEPGALWAVWAAEPPDGRVCLTPTVSSESFHVDGVKRWCSGAASVTHALMTAWLDGHTQPQLVSVEMNQADIHVDTRAWRAVGMAGSTSVDVHFNGARAVAVGRPGDYLQRAGFWHGGAGVAACWFGGAQAIADALHRAMAGTGDRESRFIDLWRTSCGRVDVALNSSAAMLREAAAWIDSHPRADAQLCALRVRLAADGCARLVLDEVGRTLGAGPYCRDAAFARAAADLPVFIRQCHGDRDFAALGQHWATAESNAWAL